MNWHLVWTDPAVHDLRRLDAKTAQRIRQALLRLVETGQGDVKPLKGYKNEYRLRIGAWRVRFSYDHGAGEVIVLRVLPRGGAYRD